MVPHAGPSNEPVAARTLEPARTESISPFPPAGTGQASRLISVTPLSPDPNDLKVEFKYDYLSRRVEKTVYDLDIGDPNDPQDDTWNTTPLRQQRFVWYNWLMIAELDVEPDGQGGETLSIRRRYTWGQDLSGVGPANGRSLAGAGGVGGLLAIQDEKVDIGGGQTALRNYLTAYDGNGNVTQLVRRNNGDLDATYEYDAYGNVIASSGLYAAQNPIRFSTKYFDDETGLGYWGLRYYDTALGRWISRDPIGEFGGLHQCAYVLNDPLSRTDSMGLCSAGCYCGPDVTDWFSKQIFRIRQRSENLAGQIGSGMLDAGFSRFWRNVKFEKALAPAFEPEACSPCPSCDQCRLTVTLCDKCINVTELGNVAFGWSISNYLDITIWGGLFAQAVDPGQRGINSDEDLIGIILGFRLRKLTGENTLFEYSPGDTVHGLCFYLDQSAFQPFRANELAEQVRNQVGWLDWLANGSELIGVGPGPVLEKWEQRWGPLQDMLERAFQHEGLDSLAIENAECEPCDQVWDGPDMNLP